MVTELYPERTDAGLEELADGLNRDYFADRGHPITPPIPIEDMAEYFLGYSIEITDEGLFSDPDFLGGIDFKDNKIYVNTSVEDHDGRYAFTVAHEIGHHVLHREAYLSGQSGSEPDILCRDTFEKPQIEIEADRFAAALLMPSNLVRDAFREIDGTTKVRTIGQARGVANKLIKNAGFTNASNTAMINRLIDLKIIPSFVGYQTGQFRKNYGRPSLGQIIQGSFSRVLSVFRP